MMMFSAGQAGRWHADVNSRTGIAWCSAVQSCAGHKIWTDIVWVLWTSCRVVWWTLFWHQPGLSCHFCCNSTVNNLIGWRTIYCCTNFSNNGNSITIIWVKELIKSSIFTMWCYASAVLTMALCLSVRPSQVGVLLKRLNVGSHKQHHTIAQGL